LSANYRERRSLLVARPDGYVTRENPPPTDPGMAFVRLDGHGHLIEFAAVPYANGPELAAHVPPETVFRAAGLDLTKFTEAKAENLPSAASDQLLAWKGPHPVIPNASVNLEIASWKGRISMVKVDYSWWRERKPE